MKSWTLASRRDESSAGPAIGASVASLRTCALGEAADGLGVAAGEARRDDIDDGVRGRGGGNFWDSLKK